MFFYALHEYQKEGTTMSAHPYEGVLRALALGQKCDLPEGTTGTNVKDGHVTIYTDGGALSADVDAQGYVSNVHGHLYPKNPAPSWFPSLTIPGDELYARDPRDDPRGYGGGSRPGVGYGGGGISSSGNPGYR